MLHFPRRLYWIQSVLGVFGRHLKPCLALGGVSRVYRLILRQADLKEKDDSGRRFFALSMERRISSASSAPSDPVDIPGARRGAEEDDGAGNNAGGGVPSLHEVGAAGVLFFFLRERGACRPSGLASRGRNGRRVVSETTA